MAKHDFHNRRNDRQQDRRQQESPWPEGGHRLRAIREREEVSLNALARRTKLKASVVKRLETENDLPLSMLYRLAKGLGVPVSELLLESDRVPCEPIRQRACLIRIARTAQTIREKSRDNDMRYLSETLVNQLTELMPELGEIGSWPEARRRRLPTDVPRLIDRMIIGVPDHSLCDQTNTWWEFTSIQDTQDT